MSNRKIDIPILLIFTIFCVSSLAVTAQQEQLASPLTARTFYDIGRELYTNEQADFLLAKQAVIFFNAAIPFKISVYR